MTQENPNAFKLWINRDVLKTIAKSLAKAYPEFDQKRFVAIAPRLESLELKGRVGLVCDQLRAQLPEDFEEATGILLASVEFGELKGFALWPYAEFLRRYGIDDLECALRGMESLTTYFTSEFAVRPYLIEHRKKTLSYLLKCTGSDNVHVRRWASEGSRPRLPWGEKLREFIADPTHTLPILERLRFDSELYVRKSVANHLNDISKDHPRIVVETLRRWRAEASEQDRDKVEWIVRRSIRSLIKNGDPRALQLVGASPNVSARISGLKLDRRIYKVGDRLEFDFRVESTATKTQRLVVDYILHYMKANGKTSPKVFKLKTFDLAKGESQRIEKCHHLKQVTTRRHYPGRHILEIQVNGAVRAKAHFELK